MLGPLVCLACTVPSTPQKDSGDSADSGGTVATSFDVTVTNGYGSGTYDVGDIVHIWSDHNPNTQVVRTWSGDHDLLPDAGEWHTSFIMPARNVTLQAELNSTPFKWVEAQFDGRDRTKTVLYYIPPDPKGFVHITHGTGGSRNLLKRIEPGYIARVLIDAGYGIWATDAEEVDVGDLDGNGKVRWNTLPSADNVDFANLTSIAGQFVRGKLIPQGTPNFIIGMSNGGAFSVVAGGALNLNAAVSYCASGVEQVAAVTTTPTAWFLCENDDNEQVDNAKSERNHEALKARGVATELYLHGPSPVYDQRFARIEGIDTETSQAIADELRVNAHVDAQDYLLQDGKVIGQSVTNAPDNYPIINGLQPKRLSTEVIFQLRIMRSNHIMYDDYARRTLAFIEGHTP